jgi:uncharacterized membrane protein YbhN (UPF0104 family)
MKKPWTMGTDVVTGAHPPAPSQGPAFTRSSWWPLAKRTATLVFFGLVAWLLVTQARSVDWADVMVSIRAYPLAVLATAAGCAIGSYAMYCSFELLSRHYAGHKLSTVKVLAATFISYAFNLNLGAIVGGLGFRFRLYTQMGLRPDVISRVFGFTMLTNWLGYMTLAGVVCLVQPLALPPEWEMGAVALSVIGVGLLALCGTYVALCGLSTRRCWTIRGHELCLPSFRLALLQLVMSCITWMMIAAVIYVLLQHRADYLTVLAVLLVSAVAGIITHVPAGLGVTEAVFVTLLSPQIPATELLAALLVFRAVHYLMPLAQATVLYALFEARLKIKGPIPPNDPLV